MLREKERKVRILVDRWLLPSHPEKALDEGQAAGYIVPCKEKLKS